MTIQVEAILSKDESERRGGDRAVNPISSKHDLAKMKPHRRRIQYDER